MSLPLQDQANILHGIRDGWTSMRSEIMNALLLGEVANQATKTETWIGDEEEGILIPRGRETSDKIQGHEMRDNEVPTLNMAIRVLTYVDPGLIKVQPK